MEEEEWTWAGQTRSIYGQAGREGALPGDRGEREPAWRVDTLVDGFLSYGLVLKLYILKFSEVPHPCRSESQFQSSRLDCTSSSP